MVIFVQVFQFAHHLVRSMRLCALGVWTYSVAKIPTCVFQETEITMAICVLYTAQNFAQKSKHCALANEIQKGAKKKTRVSIEEEKQLKGMTKMKAFVLDIVPWNVNQTKLSAQFNMIVMVAKQRRFVFQQQKM